MYPLVAAAAATLIAGCGSQHHQAETRHRGSGQAQQQRPGATQSVAAVTARVKRTEASVAGHRLSVPAGWHAELWASVPDARLEAWTPQGALLVSEPQDGRIVELTPRSGHPSEHPRRRVLVAGLSEPQGMAFARVAGHEVLYVAEDDEIDRYQWLGSRVGARSVIVAKLPDSAPAGSDNHTVKNVVVGPDQRIYVDLGSGSNAGPVQRTDPPRASVISYTSSGKDRRIIARGVRNGDGLSFAPDGSLWTAVNERDQISYPFHRSYGSHPDAYGDVIQAYVNNHPPDEVARLNPGRNLGWPYCDPDPDVRPGVAGTKFRYLNLPFIDDQQTNPHNSKLNCRKLQRLQVGLPAHSAPLGFHFLEGSRLPARWSDGAIVAVHGSWDREPPRPPAVLWLPWERKAHTLGRAITLISGFQGANGSRWGRPVDVVPGPDGALYVSDDTAGAIYRIKP